MPKTNHKIHLTFDDGPTPKVTDFVLQTLLDFGARATFFCLGQQVALYPELALRLEDMGHRVANHGFSHIDGWKVSRAEYVNNIEQGEVQIQKILGRKDYGFRPPYGHFRRTGKSAVMWSLMSGDFDQNLPKEKCLSVLKSKTEAGDIVVFHDNTRSFSTLKYVLPRYLEYCSHHHFSFGLLE